ncbi:PREDICTED: uncharacterized protein LOC108619630 [Drosophila arizonae]|uniref:Uncharacterized protein LOC108619630 n=1 Tax=Drosophila arizonae TaxID=7263 RepID=A0ABM1PX67_DROAR|nr:PREDICTED: uncharacterized protein LOC108619630 [Drosophila arizonae]
MCNWRFCLQIFLFLLILAWAGVCIKMSYDQLTKQPEKRHAAEGAIQSNMGKLWPIRLHSATLLRVNDAGVQDLYPYDLLAGSQENDRIFDNGYSSRLLHLIYRTVMHSTNDHRRQVEFEWHVAAAHRFMKLAAAAADDRLKAGLRRVSAGDDALPINMRRSIDASELVAADDFNVSHFTESSSTVSESNGDS